MALTKRQKIKIRARKARATEIYYLFKEDYWSFPEIGAEFNISTRLAKKIWYGESARRKVRTPITRSELLKVLLPGLNALFGMEYEGNGLQEP